MHISLFIGFVSNRDIGKMKSRSRPNKTRIFYLVYFINLKKKCIRWLSRCDGWALLPNLSFVLFRRSYVCEWMKGIFRKCFTFFLLSSNFLDTNFRTLKMIYNNNGKLCINELISTNHINYCESCTQQLLNPRVVTFTYIFYQSKWLIKANVSHVWNVYSFFNMALL